MINFKEFLNEQENKTQYKQTDKVKDAFLKEYPYDELGKNINPRITFKDLYQSMIQGKDFYTVIGAKDSIIRERIFNLMSKVFKIDYDHFYDLWLGDTSEKGLNKKISKIFKESREDYLNKIKSIVEKDQNFKNFKIKLNSNKNLELEPTQMYKSLYPVIYFFSSSNSVEFNFDHFKILTWYDTEDSLHFAKRFEKLANLYKYCVKIAEENWTL